MNVREQIASLERSAAATASRTNTIQDYEFAVRATCPPSTAVTVAAGKAWNDSNYHAFLFYDVEQPSEVLDFAITEDVAQGSGVFRLAFNNANHYVAVALTMRANYISLGTGLKYRVFGEATEHSSAGEAEAEIDAFLNGGFYEDSALRLWAIVFRNNGVTGVSGAIMPIDVINRGRSYLYRDLRGQTWIDG